MARLFTDSFDHYDTAHLSNKWSDLGTTGQSIVSGVTGATNNCLRIPVNCYSLVKNFPASYSTLTFGARYRVDAMGFPSRVVSFNDTGFPQLVLCFQNSGQASACIGSIGVGDDGVTTSAAGASGGKVRLLASRRVCTARFWVRPA